MTFDEIRAKCRKVYIQTTNNRVFDNANGGQYEFVNAYREKENALSNLEAKEVYIYTTQADKDATREVVAFYLVPANRID